MDENLPASLLKHSTTENRIAQPTVSGGDVRNAGKRKQTAVAGRKRQRSTRNVALPWFSRGTDTSGSSQGSGGVESMHPDHPDWSSYSTLLLGILMTGGLAVVSAWDATRQCLQHETDVLLELVDDDAYQNYEKAVETVAQKNPLCQTMFDRVVIPVGVGTAFFGCIALCMVLCQSKGVPDFRRLYPRVVFLLVLVLMVAVLQTFNVGAIMLRPRSMDAQERSNPYQSLAAVDRYGQVSANANLYYLTWITEGLALSLLYQVATLCVRAQRRMQQQHRTQGMHDVTTLLRAASWRSNSESKYAWYQQLYRLRFRTGIWTATLVACCVIVASTQYVGTEVLWPLVGKDEKMDFSNLSTYLKVCKEIAVQEEKTRNSSSYGETLPPQFCSRTVAAWFSGVVAAFLCTTAIGMHLWAKYGALRMAEEAEEDDGAHGFTSSWRDSVRSRRLPLRTELFLSVLLSLLTGFNAVFCTGVQGPAAKVGNLYYASWIAYLLCVRIALGCLEELYDLDGNKDPNLSVLQSYQAPNLGTELAEPKSDPVVAKNSVVEVSPGDDPASISSAATQSTAEEMEKLRLGHVRRYFFLAVFSVSCAASAFDAASNQNGKLSRSQLYMVAAPCYVALQSVILTALCISKRCFGFVTSFRVGGPLSVLAFSLLLGNLVLGMHSEGSWAVNGIGEIEMANLYYFSWASILTAGLHMSSYLKGRLASLLDTMSVVWISIVKVCFVTLGAGLHIWDTIHDNCGFDEITSGAVTFCSRTVLSMIVASTGMTVGGLVVLGRVFLFTCPALQCRRLQAHVEMLISLFLVLLFGASVAMITGIGGPGQSVGDMYYSTWGAFWVTLFVFISCYNALNAKEREWSPSSLEKPQQ